MRKLKWLSQFVVYVVLGAWLHLEPGILHFQWLGYEGETSIAFLLIVGAVVFSLVSVVRQGWRSIVRFWAHLWGRALPFEGGVLFDQRLRELLAEGGVYHLRPHQLGCDVTRQNDRHYKSLLSYCERLLKDRSTAWWGYWGLVHMAYRADQRAVAYDWALKAHHAYPRHAEMTRLYLVMTLVQRDDQKALDLVTLLKRQGGLSKAQARRLRSQITLSQALNYDGDEGASLYAQAVKEDPAFEPALRALCRELLNHHHTKELMRHVRHHWADVGGSVVLGTMYLEASGLEGVERFKAASQLAAYGGQAWVNETLLGIEALRAGLWGEAKRYLLPLYQRTHHPFYEKFVTFLNASETSASASTGTWSLNPSVPESTFALDEGPWVCGSCGHGAGVTYDLLCPSCGFWPCMEGESMMIQAHQKGGMVPPSSLLCSPEHKALLSAS